MGEIDAYSFIVSIIYGFFKLGVNQFINEDEVTYFFKTAFKPSFQLGLGTVTPSFKLGLNYRQLLILDEV